MEFDKIDINSGRKSWRMSDRSESLFAVNRFVEIFEPSSEKGLDEHSQHINDNVNRFIEMIELKETRELTPWEKVTYDDSIHTIKSWIKSLGLSEMTIVNPHNKNKWYVIPSE